MVLKRQINVGQIKTEFPILKRTINGNKLTYLDNAATSLKPKQVVQALVNYYENHCANVHRGVHTLSIEATELYEQARAKMAKFINAPKPENIIWTKGCTESLNLSAKMFAKPKLSKGCNIVTTKIEHHSNLIPWQKIATESGAELRIADYTSNYEVDLNHLAELVDENTKVITVAHVSNVTGIITDLKRISEIAHSVNALFVVDGASAVPYLPVDVTDIDCDLYAFSCHKMCGPTGVGVLYAKEDLQNETEPLYTGGHMVRSVSYEEATWNVIPYKFESGTANISSVIAVSEMIKFLDEIGMENIYEHEKNLVKIMHERIAEFKDYKFYTPKNGADKVGIFAFSHNKIHPHDIGSVLNELGIAVRTGHHCAMPLVRSFEQVATARASFYIYNDESDDIDIFIKALKQVERYFIR